MQLIGGKSETIVRGSTDITTETNNKISALNFTIGVSCNLGLNEEYQLCVKDQNGEKITSGLIYSSSNENVVSIDSNGKITGKKIGSATIYANAENGTQGSSVVTVKSAPNSIKHNLHTNFFSNLVMQILYQQYKSPSARKNAPSTLCSICGRKAVVCHL